MIIRSKAPFRVSFGGGGTDMPPYCTEYGGCVINTTIDRHVFVSLIPRKDRKIRVFSLGYNNKTIFVHFDLILISGKEKVDLSVVDVIEINDMGKIKSITAFKK